jgi:hypothetical protein
MTEPMGSYAEHAGKGADGDVIAAARKRRSSAGTIPAEMDIEAGGPIDRDALGAAPDPLALPPPVVPFVPH